MASHTRPSLFLSLDNITPTEGWACLKLQWQHNLGVRAQNARLALDCNLGGSRTPKPDQENSMVISAIFLVCL